MLIIRKNQTRLNPYYIGRYSLSRIHHNSNTMCIHCLNPYYIGRYSLRFVMEKKPVNGAAVLILIILEDTL